jgi:hypothetical protein
MRLSIIVQVTAFVCAYEQQKVKLCVKIINVGSKLWKIAK